MLIRLTQDIAMAPNGLNVVLTFRSICELLAQPAYEDINDLGMRLVHLAVKIVEECLLV